MYAKRMSSEFAAHAVNTMQSVAARQFTSNVRETPVFKPLPRYTSVLPAPYAKGGKTLVARHEGVSYYSVRVNARYWASPDTRAIATVCVGWMRVSEARLLAHAFASFGTAFLRGEVAAAHGIHGAHIYMNGLLLEEKVYDGRVAFYNGSVELWCGHAEYALNGVKHLLEHSVPAPQTAPRLKRPAPTPADTRPTKRARGLPRTRERLPAGASGPDDVHTIPRFLRLVFGSWAEAHRDWDRVADVFPDDLVGVDELRAGLRALAHTTRGGAQALEMSDEFLDNLVLYMLNGAGNNAKRKADLANAREVYDACGRIDAYTFLRAAVDRLNRYMRTRHKRTGFSKTRDEWETPPARVGAHAAAAILEGAAKKLRKIRAHL